ncbi:MAG TPA: histidine kinase [Chitinophagaceae bacterium]|nr:histidine kinase [Chitinophagaceae bacterium]
MVDWVNTHPTVDSQYILTLHRISYRGIDKDVKRSFYYYEKVSYYSDSLNFVYGKGLAQINLGILFSFSGNFDASNKAYFKAIEYAESCNAQRLKAVSLNNVGENFRILRDFAKCRRYTREAIDINSAIAAWRGVAINYELLQQCDMEEKLYDSAKNNLIRGMEFARRSKDSSVFSLFYLGFGKLHAINNQRDSALFYFDKAVNESKYYSLPTNEYNVYLAEVKYLKGISTDDKLNLLRKALRIASDPANLQRLTEVAHQLSFVFDEKNNKDSSMAWFKNYRLYADSLYSENNQRNVAIKETEWMVKRKEIENAHLLEFTRLQNKELAVKNAMLLAVGISLLLIIGIAAVVYKSIQNSKKTAESKLRQNIAETQMQVLRSQMNPHFIFNSLNSIDAFIQSNDKYNATLYLNKFAKLIRNVLDSSKQDVISFSKDIETLKLYIELEIQRSENKFTTDIIIDDELMNSDYKVPPLIIQPFVENAIIHGLRNRDDNKGLLQIMISKTERQIFYSITDNGVGRKAAGQMQSRPGKSYGIEMTLERVKLFNKEASPSVEITDLYEGGQPAGTNVLVHLNII